MPNGNINGNLATHGHIAGVLTIGSGGGTSDYELLENKPQINGHELIDNQTAHELGLASTQDVSDIESDIALLSQKLPKNYSTNEQNTGIKWIDGKYIYIKTFDLGSEKAFSTGWQFIIPHNNQYNMVFKGELINESGICYQLDIACNDATYIEGYFTHSTTGRLLTFQYTKNE